MLKLITLCSFGILLSGCFFDEGHQGRDDWHRRGDLTAPVTLAAYHPGCNRNGHYCRHHRHYRHGYHHT